MNSLTSFIEASLFPRSSNILYIFPLKYELPDLFVFSLIRYFAVSDWNDETIRQAHASVALTIRKLLNNEFEDELKLKVKTAIVEYLKLFNV